MRAVVAWLVATVSWLALLAPTAAAPPEDVAAYCRATYPQRRFQVRCLNVEHAAAERVSLAIPGADRDVVNRCLSGTASWVAMETCLAQSMRGGPHGGAPGGVMPAMPVSAVSPGAPRPDRERGGPSAGPAPGTAIVPPSPAPVERPTRPISEADADRQLRGILERTGTSAAQCSKKQYGPGWVTICDDPRSSSEHGRVDTTLPRDDERVGFW